MELLLGICYHQSTGGIAIRVDLCGWTMVRAMIDKKGTPKSTNLQQHRPAFGLSGPHLGPVCLKAVPPEPEDCLIDEEVPCPYLKLHRAKPATRRYGPSNAPDLHTRMDTSMHAKPIVGMQGCHR